MCGQIGCNKSEFHKKKLMGYWRGWRGIRGIWNLFAPPAFPDSFQRATSISWGKKIVKFPKKSFLKENCYFRESPHTDRQRPQGILDLYVAARQGFPELQMFQKRYCWGKQIVIRKDFYKFLNEGHLFAQPVFVKDSACWLKQGSQGG